MKRRCDLFLYFLLFFVSFEAHSAANKNHSRQDACQTFRVRALKDHAFMRVPVPVDYDKPELGFTSIYTWTNRKFRRDWKTLVFVSGGPGNHDHDSRLNLSNWNLIFFDQRGIACSKLNNEAQNLNKESYSSKHTARDIEEIRKAYGMDKISLYAVSYGTVPATIYASLYADHTRSLVLEGTVAVGGEQLIGPDRRRVLLQNFFEGLPKATQDRILELSSKSDIPRNWFSVVGMLMLYLDNGYEAYQAFLENVLSDDQIAKDLIGTVIYQKSLKDNSDDNGLLVSAMLGCQELGMNLTNVSSYFVFRGRKLVPDTVNHMNSMCVPLGFPLDTKTKLYDSSAYPVRVPVYYIQGAKDGATVIDHAYQHAYQTTQSRAYLLIADQGGHQPLSGDLVSGYADKAKMLAKQTLLAKILDGQSLQGGDLRSLEKNMPLKWRVVIKE